MKESEEDQDQVSLVLNSKSIARIISVQCSYCFDINDKNEDTDRILRKVLYFYKSKNTMLDSFDITESFECKINHKYCETIFSEAVKNVGYIDELVSGYLDSERKIDKMHVMLSSILRCGVSELLYFPKVPYKVVVKEYTDISREMNLPINDVHFINSILDKVAKKLIEQNSTDSEKDLDLNESINAK